MGRPFPWKLVAGLLLAWLAIGLPTELLAQEGSAQEQAFEAMRRGRPGGYLSLLKLGLIAVIFILWVAVVDWINRDAMQFGKKTGLKPEFWNPIIVISFLIAFMVVITVPLFWAGYPVYVAFSLLPPMMYLLVRRGKLKQDAALARTVKSSKGKPVDEPPEVLPQDDGAEVTFSPGGADDNDRKSRLIRARQTGGFADLKDLIFNAQFKRADQLLLDFTPNGVGIRILVDGTWHALEPMERQAGDAMLASLKYLTGLNVAERRAQQKGEVAAKSDHGKVRLVVVSQGVPTGERVVLRFDSGAQSAVPLDQLGMFPDMLDKVKQAMDHAGVSIISSPPGHGFTSTWQGALMTTDRLTRDCVAFINQDETESDIENVTPKYYDPVGGPPQVDALRALLLTQPDMLVVPQVEDAATMDLLVDQALNQERSILFRTPARSAAEALLRVYSQAGDRQKFLEATKVVTCQRLARRLCPTCRTEVRVQPQLIQQLGGEPRAQGTLFNQYQLPPPEQRIDEKGNPIEIPPCETCGGIGYIGRIAIFECLEMSDELRKVVRSNPQAATIEAAALKLGKKSLTQQAYQLVLLGVTSLAEVQRVLKMKT